MTRNLLCKWWWKLENEVGLWQEIIKFKYLRDGSICTVKERQDDSPIWLDVLKIKDIYMQGKRIT